MNNETLLCAGCGITLRPFMKSCPRCGLKRQEATLLEPQTSAEASSAQNRLTNADAPMRTLIIPINTTTQPAAPFAETEFSARPNVVFLSPDETKRRFPLFTPAQLTLLALGAALLGVALVIGFMLWRQQRRDQLKSVPTALIQPTPVVLPSSPTPVPTPSADQSIYEAVKSALMAYNPLGFARYKFDVKDGVLTLDGEAAHQPEKDGAENVVRMLPGVRSVVNNLKVKPELAGGSIKVNPAEAKLLEEALQRQTQESQNIAPPAPTPNAEAEAERQRREQLAIKQREEEAALRQAAEEKLRREAEEQERRLEEQRRADAERRARAEQARLEASVLRSGTVAWSGVVDGVDEIIISGAGASVRHLNGNPPREVRASFSAPLPRAPLEVKMIWTNGRGQIDLVQQPSVANGYTTIIRLDDSRAGGDKRYEFTLRWNTQ